MVTVAIYDIGENRGRLKVEAVLRNYGLRRIQYSVFRGRINADDRALMVNELTSLNPKNKEGAWDIQVYIISEDDFLSHIRMNKEGPVSDLMDEQEVVII